MGFSIGPRGAILRAASVKEQTSEGDLASVDSSIRKNIVTFLSGVLLTYAHPISTPI